MKKSAIQQIGQDTVDIQSIWLQLKLTRDKRNQIFTTLYNLIRKQIPSQQMNFLIEIFEKSLCFDEKLSSLKKKVNQRFLRFDQQQKPLYLIDQQTCSAFISLTNIGQIVMVSNNFEKVVPIFSNSESIGKNINFMQPSAVSQFHDKILNNYLTKIRSQKSQLSLSPIIGIDREGWAIPYDIKLQPCLIESKDFGICAQIKQIEGLNMFLLVDQKDFRIICNSQEFYNQILSKVVSKKQLQDINISKLIPSLRLILSKNYKEGENFQTTFSTIMIKPQDKSEIASLNEFILKQGNLNQLLEFDLFSIKGKLYSISNHYIQLLQIEIEDMMHLSDQNTKIEEIKSIQQQIISNKDYYEQIYSEEKTHSLEFLSNKYLNSQSSPILQNKISLEKQTQIQSSKEQQNYTINQLTSQANQINPYSQNNDLQNELSANQLSFIQEINYENSNQYYQAEDEFQFTKILSPQTSINLINKQVGQQIVQDEKDNSLLYDNKMSFLSQQKRFVFQNRKQQSTFEGTKQSADTFQAQQTKLSSCNLLQQQGLLSTSRNNNFISNNPQQVSQKDSTMRDSLSRQIEQINIKQDIHVEGSVQTSQSGRTSFRKSIIESIQAPLKIKGLTLVKLTWSIAFFGFLILNIFNYYSLGQSLKTQKSQYKYIDWGSKLLTTLSQSICDQMLMQALSIPYFQPKQDTQKNIIKNIQSKQIQRHQIMKQLMIDYVNSDKSESDTFSFAMDYHQTFTFAFTTVRIENYYLGFGYIQEALFAYMYQQVYSLDPLGQNSLQISLNYVNTTNSVQAIQNYVNAKLNDNFDSTIRQEFISMTIILVTSIIFSVSFIPIYSLIQSKRQEILILFTTFPPNKLMFLLSETINYINILQISEEKLNRNQNNHKKKDLAKSYGQANNIDVKNLIKKKKNISTFNRLPRFDFKILLYSALFFVLVQIHSMTSYFLVKDFFTSERSNRQFINDFLNVTDFSSNVNIVRIPLVLLTLAQNKELLALYIARGETNLSRVSLELNLLYSVVDNYYSVTRYKQDEFNKYISGILQGNACQQVAQNLDLLTDSGFSLEECDQAANGIFTAGLVKSVKQVCDLYVSRMPVYYIKNLKVFLGSIIEQEKSYSFIDSYYYRLYLFYIVQSVQQKVANLTYDHYNLMINLNHILLSISLVSQMLAIVIAYIKFFQKQMNQLKETKLLLDLVEIHALEENQYILTYFKLSK
ncbi:transmembrane protein, putative (macronuclear) [Tetrahymena thermophila SB210]|uniref:Transmembrane protein, putative n=1 Tax=Tetrahymena thermophila (strain SB210) TaxID=312017 RepID=I7LTX3_TETTS|nr:transmembrane protein, putative [Tetrahymena thermophila SB210]EAR87465.2 transmembrane protein, putative [Tetrahymena thermophila SB210]|eukprot:XP_001007710.2 transmembrane protein, putative [Tetrahymena thermophila SB210]